MSGESDCAPNKEEQMEDDLKRICTRLNGVSGELVKAYASEKRLRTYFQGLLYESCRLLDMALGGTTTVGGPNEPSTVFADRVQRLIRERNEAQSQLSGDKPLVSVAPTIDITKPIRRVLDNGVRRPAQYIQQLPGGVSHLVVWHDQYQGWKAHTLGITAMARAYENFDPEEKGCGLSEDTHGGS